MVTVLPCLRSAAGLRRLRDARCRSAASATFTRKPASSSCLLGVVDRQPAHVRHLDHRRPAGDHQRHHAVALGACRRPGPARSPRPRSTSTLDCWRTCGCQPGRADRAGRRRGAAAGDRAAPAPAAGRWKHDGDRVAAQHPAAGGRARSGSPDPRRPCSLGLDAEAGGQVRPPQPGRRLRPGQLRQRGHRRRSARCRTTTPPRRPDSASSSTSASASHRPVRRRRRSAGQARCRPPAPIRPRRAGTAPAPAGRRAAGRPVARVRRPPVRAARPGWTPARSARSRPGPPGRQPAAPAIPERAARPRGTAPAAGPRSVRAIASSASNTPASGGRPPGSRLVARSTSSSSAGGDPGGQRGRRRHVVVHVPVRHRHRRVAPVRRGAGEQLEEQRRRPSRRPCGRPRRRGRPAPGRTYATVPSTIPAWVDVLGAATARASPKSTTLTVPSVETSTFSGLTSRCTRPARCAAASAAEHRLQHRDRLVRAQPAAPAQHLAQRAAGDQLHHQEDDPAGPGLLGALVEDGDRVGVRQPGRGAGLPDEAVGERRVVRQRRRHHLDRDPAVQSQVGPRVHGRHAAAGDRRVHPVAPVQHRPRRGGRRGRSRSRAECRQLGAPAGPPRLPGPRQVSPRRAVPWVRHHRGARRSGLRGGRTARDPQHPIGVMPARGGSWDMDLQ